jgi:predicted anti-sigma-YlaC factor YlaD
MAALQRTSELDEKASLFSSSSSTRDLESDAEDTAFLLKSTPRQSKSKISHLNVALLCFNLVIATISIISWMRIEVATTGQYHFAYDHGEFHLLRIQI